jgi:hypothetical protein
MVKKIDNRLKNSIKQSKTKKELITKLSKDDPEFLIKYFENIERVANIIYNEKEKTPTRKRKIKEIISSDEEYSSEQEENLSEEEENPKKTRKINRYNNFIKKESQNLKNVDSKDRFKILGEMWKNSPENPKNI